MGTIKAMGKSEKKKLLIWVILELILIVSFVGVIVGKTVGDANASNPDTVYQGDETSMEQYIRDIVEVMFEEKEIVTMSEDSLKLVTATITSDVLNSLPDTLQSDEEMAEELREWIEDVVNDAVKDIVDDAGEDISDDVIADIRKEIVPEITALIQINTGEIEDLKASLSSLSSAYNSDKARYDKAIDDLYSKVKEGGGAPTEEYENLSTLFEDYKSETSAKITSIEAELQEMEDKLQILINSQIETLRNSLVAQIETNKELSESQKTDLEAEINALADSAATAEELGAVVTELSARISLNAEANKQELNNALETLLGNDATAGITISELEDRIAAADISPEQKQSLLDAIAASYADATADTTIQVAEAKSALQAEIDTQTAALTNAVNALQVELETKLADLEVKVTGLINTNIETLRNSLIAQIDLNKNLSDEQKAELEAEINSLAKSAATSTELSKAVSDLTAEINQSAIDNQTALNDAINNLLGDDATAGITISELEDRIAAADISQEQKQSLLDAIAASYADATADTTVKVAEAKAALQEEIDNQTTALTTAMDSLQYELESKLAELEIKVTGLINTNIETLKNSLLAQIELNKDLSDEQKAELEEEIRLLANKAATSDELSAAVADLAAEISQTATDNQTALNDAINSLLGDDATAGITISELEDRIAAADISPEQKQSLLDAIAASYADATADTTVQVADAKAALQTEIDNKTAALTTAMDSLEFELETKLAELEIKVTGLINTNIETLRNSLLAQIEANKELSDEQKAELEAEINTLANNSATSAELSDAVAGLMAEINQSAIDNQTALNDAINNLLGDDATAGITISELEDRIAAADISPEQKQSLLDAIAASYADATADTTVKVADAKAALQTEIDNKTAALTATVNSVQTQLESQISDMQAEMDQLSANLQSQINTIINNAGGCTIYYNEADGHFYITNEDGSVSKKLDFAQ